MRRVRHRYGEGGGSENPVFEEMPVHIREGREGCCSRVAGAKGMTDGDDSHFVRGNLESVAASGLGGESG